VTDAVQAFRQNMHQEAPDELARCERHGLEAFVSMASALALNKRS
jgi:hypothetical protein